MKFKVLVTVFNAKSRFMKRKSLQADSNVTDNSNQSERDVVKQVQDISPQELEKKLLQDMAEAVNILPMTKMISLDIPVSHLQALKKSKGKADIGRSGPGVNTFLTGTTACTTGNGALTGTTLAAVPSRVAKSDVPSEKGPIQHITTQHITTQHTTTAGTTQYITTQHITTAGTTKRRLHIDDFVSITLLGAGGFGSVFLVFDTVSHRYYALKMIEKKRIHHEFYSQMFEEQRIGRALADSPWSVGVVGSFDDSTNFYILMNCSTGGDLQQRMRNHGPIDPNISRRVFADLVIGLDDLHQRRIMHHDIKAANILLEESGHVQYADFGLSKAFGVSPEERPWNVLPAWNAHQTNNEAAASPGSDGRDLAVDIVGTPGYTAPEVQAGAPHSYEADIFSLGVTFCILLFGQSPFGVTREMSNGEVAARIAHAPPVFPPQAGPRTRDLISRMLEKDPERRITMAQIKAHPFFRSFDWEVVAQRVPSSELKAELFRGVEPHLIPKEPGIRIPSGTPYAEGESPFPWFEYASPILAQPAPVNVAIPASHMISPGPLMDDEDDYHPRPAAPRTPSQIPSSKKTQMLGGLRAAVMKKLKIWGGNLVEVRPRVGERMMID